MRKLWLQPGFTENQVKAVLASGQFIKAECYTITPTEGAVMRYTDTQRDVSVVEVFGVNRYIYEANKVLITGLRSRSSIGIEVDEQDAEIAYSESDTLFQNWISWANALKLGRLDGAIVTRDRFFRASWAPTDPWMAGCRMFSGFVSMLDTVGRTKASIKVKSILEKLNVQMPRDLYQPPCKNVLGDTKCGVDLNAVAVIGTVGAGASKTVIPWTGADPLYGIGKIHITNTDMATRIRTVSFATSTDLVLVYPLDFIPPAGMEFTAYPGCDRSFARCGDFHASPEDHFGGYPFVPVAETAA